MVLKFDSVCVSIAEVDFWPPHAIRRGTDDQEGYWWPFRFDLGNHWAKSFATSGLRSWYVPAGCISVWTCLACEFVRSCFRPQGRFWLSHFFSFFCARPSDFWNSSWIANFVYYKSGDCSIQSPQQRTFLVPTLLWRCLQWYYVCLGCGSVFV